MVEVIGEEEDGTREVNVGEDSFLVKLSHKRIVKIYFVAQSANIETMRSKKAIRGKSMGDETQETKG